MMPTQQYVFRARCTRVIDGDTIDAEIDAGFHDYHVERLRLLGINAPERKAATLAAGNAARDFVTVWMMDAAGGGSWPLTIQTVKTDVFGRYLATVWHTSSGKCLNDDLLNSGNAVPFTE